MSYLPMLQQYTKNPLDDEEVVQRIINAYAASFHFDQNFYNALFSQYSNGGAFSHQVILIYFIPHCLIFGKTM